MVKKIITWLLPPDNKYVYTSPSYNRVDAGEETEDEMLERVWARLVATPKYNITIDHPHFFVEAVDQRERLGECCGRHFFRSVFPTVVDANGLPLEHGNGAWEMDVDGRPTINMATARGIQMDYIRKARIPELSKLDNLQERAMGRGDDAERASIETRKQTLRDIPQTFDLTTDTPVQLRDKWPSELPARE